MKRPAGRPQPPQQAIPDHAPSVPPQPLPRPKRARKVSTGSTSAVQTALAIAEAALSKKAANVEIIDLEGKADYTDFLVLMSGGSDRHVRALADAIVDHLREKTRARPLSVEGTGGGTWVLIDYGDVVAHVFQESTRALYDLDGLWLDAARVPGPDE
ncbi:MAG: ribosome silencing factor [Polyangiaceae bacterium]|nr:ribosome silencing factor [Polyangiaceae bacterium]